jgi:hypothetical protein
MPVVSNYIIRWTEVGWIDRREPHEDGGIAAVVVRGEERLRIGPDAKIPLFEPALDGQELPVFPQAEKKTPAHAKGRRAVRGAFLDRRERERKPAGGLEGHLSVAR